MSKTKLVMSSSGITIVTSIQCLLWHKNTEDIITKMMEEKSQMCNTALDVLSKRLFEMYFQINRAMDGYY